MNEDYNNAFNGDSSPNSYQYQEEAPKAPEKKKGGSIFLKIIALILAAAVFGATAGLTMFAVTKVTGVYDAYKNAVSTLTQPQETREALKEVELETGAEVTADAQEVPDEKAEPAPVQASSSEDVSDIVEACMPSVVAITGMTELSYSSWFGQSQKYEVPSSGSGIIIGENEEEYLIVTNNHVVEDTNSLSVAFIDEETAPAAVKGRDAATDVAIIAIKKTDVKEETAGQIRVAKVGNSDDLKVGQKVIAIGNALGYGQSVTVGYVSALDREVEVEDGVGRNLLQTDAAINPGNSGGALINMNGEVIGINSAKYSSMEVEGMGYAIPISKVQDVIDNLSSMKTREKVDEAKQGYLGIQGQNIDAAMAKAYDMPEGVYIYKILEDTGAAASELQEKDVIVKLDGQSVTTMESLKEMLTKYEKGETVVLSVKRLEGTEYADREIEVTLTAKPLTSPVQPE